MGLHDSFDSERSQILMQDPLPDLERAFSMVFAVEKQRAVHVDMAESSSHMACQLAFKENRKEGADKIIHKKKPYVDKKNLFCTHCRKTGHAQDTCFQLHGVPEWFKSLSHKKRRGDTSRPFAANIDEKSVTTEREFAVGSITNYANYAHYDEEFAVNLLSVSQLSKSRPYQFLFSQHDCVLQDLVTKASLLVGTLFKKLYVFKHCSTSSPSVSMKLNDISCSTSLQFALWTYLLKHKSQVPSILQSFHHMIRNQFDKGIKILHILHPLQNAEHSTPSTLSPNTLSSSPDSLVETAHSAPPDPPPLRRSNRQIHKPSWLNDFVSYSSNPSLLCPSNFAYISFVASLSVLQDPKTFSEAVQHEEWREAMSTELRALEQNNTWKLTPLPNGKKAIGCKWVFKTKLRADGTVERHKARLVAKVSIKWKGLITQTVFLLSLKQ
ncbi:UNVERIFIED_CONTAM: putative mitochondrial protein [Sesamum radiatum]|uniref:Mitochondrial protein n=1 Tax=Sesamum radiatum TaxID=300843 RepID=A0AAW2R4H5_SESRA